MPKMTRLAQFLDLAQIWKLQLALASLEDIFQARQSWRKTV